MEMLEQFCKLSAGRFQYFTIRPLLISRSYKHSLRT